MSENFNFSKFLSVAQKNLGSNFSEKKERIYVKMNGNFEKNHQCVEFVVALLIYQIKENISDLHVGAFNNVEWSIKYRKNKMIETLTYDEIKPTLFEVIDYFFQDESEGFRQIKKEYYDTFMLPLKEFKLVYSEDQIFNHINHDYLTKEEKEILENTSEKKLKLLFIQRINEAFQVMYKFHDGARDQEGNITIGYGETIDSVIEGSFRIEGKKQDIEIDGKSFFSIVSRLMMTDFFTLSQLGVGDYESLFREKLLTKKLNIIGGETNSGKSTTILSLLKETYDSLQGKIKIYSIENPIEKPVNFILQTQIKRINGDNPNENYLFEDAERFFLRSDPDGILIGEIRDYNTANIAMKLALSGHFCYATLHIGTALGVVPRFQGWGLDMKNNITALGFVEITQLVTTFKTDIYNKDDKIVTKIKNGMLMIEDLKELPYKYFEEYLEEKKREKEGYISEKLNDQLRELFKFMQGRSYLLNIFDYYHTGNENKLFGLQEYYRKYLKYISTYFSNRYVDGSEFIGKKEIILRFLKIFNKYFLERGKTTEFILSTKKHSKEELQQYYSYMFSTLKKEQEKFKKELEFLQKKENMNIILSFLGGNYKNNKGFSIPFTFIDFFELIGKTGNIPFNCKSKGVVPIIEIFDYTEDYKLVLTKDYDSLYYGTKAFTPMFMYGFLNINQKILQEGRTIDFFNIISMFSSEYDLG